MNRPTIELIAFAVLFGTIGYCWIGLAPAPVSPFEYLANPAQFALVGATMSAASYTALSLWRADSLAWRRLLLAVFLGCMPLIYLWSAIVSSNHDAIVLESIGFAVFLPIAVLEYRRSLLVVGTGIAAHGIGWDAWHHHHATYMEPWYPEGCLLVDLAFFLVVAAQHYSFRVTPDRPTPAAVESRN